MLEVLAAGTPAGLRHSLLETTAARLLVDHLP